jgi:PIN domain
MKPKVYVETTIVSYLTARPSRDLIIAAHQQLTQEWWKNRREQFDLFISQLVLQESGAGDQQAASERLAVLSPLPILELNQASLDLARELLDKRALPQKAELDSLHISVATVHGMEYLLTWNCRHCKCADAARNFRNLFGQRIRGASHLHAGRTDGNMILCG